VPYEKWTNSPPDLKKLRLSSDKRLSSNQEFGDISEQSKILLERQKKTLEPLNIDEAGKERKSLAALKVKHDSKLSKGKNASEKNQDTSNLSEEERRQLWLKETAEDPYVQEAMSVLSDMIAGNSRPALQKNALSAKMLETSAQ
jgi:hypothetical protein